MWGLIERKDYIFKKVQLISPDVHSTTILLTTAEQEMSSCALLLYCIYFFIYLLTILYNMCVTITHTCYLTQ